MSTLLERTLAFVPNRNSISPPQRMLAATGLTSVPAEKPSAPYAPPKQAAQPIPPSLFTPECHKLEKQTTEEVDAYFLKNWPFSSTAARKKFVAAGFSRVTCQYFPKALDDRIAFACKLLTILFLIDDVLEEMSFEAGSVYNEKLIPIARGDVKPDRSVPVEWMFYDLWEDMRAHDKELADEILEPVFLFMRAQTDSSRSKSMGLGDYFVYRERDVGKALLSALMRFSMKLHLSTEELQAARPIEQNCSKHISVINDIYSFEKEVVAAEELHAEGGVLCNSVQIVADESSVSVAPAKRALFVLVRDWEKRHLEMVWEMENGKPTQDMKLYAKGLEYQMSGNELWSHTTKRYSETG